MSYQIDGRKYVVIAAGGHGGARTTRGGYLAAFSLDADQPGSKMPAESQINEIVLAKIE